MGKQKKDGITWCDRSWNPLRGCSRISEGCRNCYAERTAARFSGEGQPYHGLASKTTDGPRWSGKVQLILGELDKPKRWSKPQTVFVNSMSDTFHPAAVETNATYWIVHAIVDAPKHVYLLLTKRALEMRDFMRRYPGGCNLCTANCRPWQYNHVWHGVSVENQQAADERIPLLLDTPCAHRWLSMEPLIGPVHLKPEWLGPGKIEWIVVGGESGTDARPMHPLWARSLLKKCSAAGVKIHFKQWGEWRPIAPLYEHPGEPARADCDDPGSGREIFLAHDGYEYQDHDGQPTCEHTWVMTRSGKKSSGRQLDGKTYDWMPRPEGADRG